ncbi:hypothetical protein AURDEDRAFT_166218 [Auricularia subglabra TFB-10046 SS5]|nr:hypothetical protein AURDEDRAFT_166218 [Auricularia subglabra TFB-10046 SS5]
MDPGPSLSALADILSLCRNIDSLALDGGAYLDEFCGELLRVRPTLHAMPALRYLHALPEPEDAVSSHLALHAYPRHFRHLHIRRRKAEMLLPLLLSGRWTAHTVTLDGRGDLCGSSCSPRDLPIARLVIRLTSEAQSVDPLASFAVYFCTTLRSLDISATDLHTFALLSAVLPRATCRLRHLSLMISLLPAPHSYGRERMFSRIVALILSMPLCISRLRSLRICLPHPVHDAWFEPLIPFCGNRRIVYTISRSL